MDVMTRAEDPAAPARTIAGAADVRLGGGGIGVRDTAVGALMALERAL
jgi:hypothetical protein